MNISVQFQSVNGKIRISASKSYTQRAFAAALLHNGHSDIYFSGQSEDELAALNIIQKLGAIITSGQDYLRIESSGVIKTPATINCGESGLAARLFIPIAAVAKGAITVEGKGSLGQRPMVIFEKILSQFSVSVLSQNGFLPFTINGPIVPVDAQIDGSLSSQFISGLLFAMSAAYHQNAVCLSVLDLVSKPYIDMTLDVLAHWGKPISHENYSLFYMPANAKPETKTIVKYFVEGDWSSAAFWIAAAALSGEIFIEGLMPQSLQADKKIIEILQKVGAIIEWQQSTLRVAHQFLESFEADLEDCPDLFPVLAVVAACCNGLTKLHGVHRLAHKESNRALAILDLLHQLGVEASVQNKTLLINGVASLNAIEYDCPNDHRMAMAAALSNIKANGATVIFKSECVRKSYPQFWDDLRTFSK